MRPDFNKTNFNFTTIFILNTVSNLEYLKICDGPLLPGVYRTSCYTWHDIRSKDCAGTWIFNDQSHRIVFCVQQLLFRRDWWVFSLVCCGKLTRMNLFNSIQCMGPMLRTCCEMVCVRRALLLCYSCYLCITNQKKILCHKERPTKCRRLIQAKIRDFIIIIKGITIWVMREK